MILFYPVNLKDLYDQGKEYKWTKPTQCGSCDSGRIWGHGFVQALFDGFSKPLWIKRYRCPDCKCVIRSRPKGYFPRFQAPIETIRSSILNKSKKNKWIPHVSYTRQGHWFKAFRQKVMAHLGISFHVGPEAFDELLSRGLIPISRTF